jgi:hypothetical protein
MVATGLEYRWVLAALQHQARARLVRRQLDRPIDERQILQEAVRMSFGRASSIRVASSLAAKPPNTTE